MFSAHDRLRLVDMDVTRLRDEDLDRADLVTISTMVVQQRSLHDVIARSNARRRWRSCRTGFRAHLRAGLR